jgi:hypothetical protein
VSVRREITKHLPLRSDVTRLGAFTSVAFELKVEDGDELFGFVLEAAALQSIQLTGEHLLLSGIRRFIDTFLLKLRWRTSSVVFDSCHRLDATVQQSSNSSHLISTGSCVALNPMPFSMTYDIISHGFLGVDGNDFIRKASKRTGRRSGSRNSDWKIARRM